MTGSFPNPYLIVRDEATLTGVRSANSEGYRIALDSKVRDSYRSGSIVLHFNSFQLYQDRIKEILEGAKATTDLNEYFEKICTNEVNAVILKWSDAATAIQLLDAFKGYNHDPSNLIKPLGDRRSNAWRGINSHSLEALQRCFENVLEFDIYECQRDKKRVLEPNEVKNLKKKLLEEMREIIKKNIDNFPLFYLQTKKQLDAHEDFLEWIRTEIVKLDASNLISKKKENITHKQQLLLIRYLQNAGLIAMDFNIGEGKKYLLLSYLMGGVSKDNTKNYLTAIGKDSDKNPVTEDNLKEVQKIFEECGLDNLAEKVEQHIIKLKKEGRSKVKM